MQSLKHIYIGIYRGDLIPVLKHKLKRGKDLIYLLIHPKFL